jgi:hypothetical protein
MGCCQSTFDREGKSRNDLIDDQIRKDKVNLKNEIKMLLLGRHICSALASHGQSIDALPILQVLENLENPLF